MAGELLFEIGCEELPASYAIGALSQLPELMRKALEDAGVDAADLEIQAVGTPRRLATCVRGLPAETPKKTVPMTGPPVKAGDRAAQGFAKKHGASADALEIVETEKGEYYQLDVTTGGQAMSEVLAGLLPGVIDRIAFPKSMRWGDGDVRFARPLRWLLALFDGAVVDFSWGDLKSAEVTRGHRFIAPNPIAVTGFDDYVSSLGEAGVMVDPEQRRERVWNEVEKAAKRAGGVPESDDALLDTVTFLVEQPTGVTGRFDEKMLEMPRQVVVTPMKHHQRYFPVLDGDSQLLNAFVTVAGTPPKDEAVVADGNERVLRARLEDARFFYDEDLRTPLDDMVERLERVVFQSKLGSYGDKVRRITELSKGLAGLIGSSIETESIEEAARLCKADLNSKMVYEFPELEGIMGRDYALKAGVSEYVADAIAEHLQPRGADDDLPASDLGALLGIADRLDTLVGLFGIGEKPSGSADPYGMRRHALAVLAILKDKAWSVSVADALGRAATNLAEDGKIDDPDASAEAATAFFRERLYHLMTAEGLVYDAVDAVLEAGFDHIVDAWARARALTDLKSSPDLEPVAVGFKRAANILEKAPAEDLGADLAEDALEHDSEKALHDAFASVRDDVRARLERKDFSGALEAVVALRKPIDDFYDAVMVMDENDTLRRNRLALLAQIVEVFSPIADFSRIVVEGK